MKVTVAHLFNGTSTSLDKRSHVACTTERRENRCTRFSSACGRATLLLYRSLSDRDQVDYQDQTGRPRPSRSGPSTAALRAAEFARRSSLILCCDGDGRPSGPFASNNVRTTRTRYEYRYCSLSFLRCLNLSLYVRWYGQSFVGSIVLPLLSLLPPSALESGYSFLGS